LKKSAILWLSLFLGLFAPAGGAALARDAPGGKPASAKPRGTMTWVRTFGSPELDLGHSVRQTSDGGYALSGYTFQSSRQRPDLWVLKLDAQGSKAWERTFENAVHGNEEYLVSPGPDGALWVLAPKDIGAGPLSRVIVRVIKLEASGRVAWDREFAEHSVAGFSLLATPDGGGLVGGYGSHGGRQVPWLMKLDGEGKPVWEKFLESAGGVETVTALLSLPDRHTAVATSASWKKGLRLVKIDAAGNAAWSKAYRSGNDTERVRSLSLTSDGGFLLAGEAGSTQFDGFILKLDAQGGRMWDRLIPGAGSGAYAQPARDGGILAVRRQENAKTQKVDIFLAKFDRNGNPAWAKVLGEGGASYLVFALDGTADGGCPRRRHGSPAEKKPGPAGGQNGCRRPGGKTGPRQAPAPAPPVRREPFQTLKGGQEMGSGFGGRERLKRAAGNTESGRPDR